MDLTLSSTAAAAAAIPVVRAVSSSETMGIVKAFRSSLSFGGRLLSHAPGRPTWQQCFFFRYVLEVRFLQETTHTRAEETGEAREGHNNWVGLRNTSHEVP